MEIYRLYLAPEGYFKQENKMICHSLQQCCSIIDTNIEQFPYFKACIIQDFGNRDDLIYIAYTIKKEEYYDWRDNLKAKKLKLK